MEVEELGYHSAMVNDHYSTMPYVREMFSEPPRFYEPLVSLAYVAARTSRVKLMTGVVVMPMREPVVLAKQVATLDQMSGGRLTLGLGVGSYRAEFESVRPLIKDTPRSGLVDEGIESLQELFNQRRATYRGKYVAFDDVELFPEATAGPVAHYSPSAMRPAPSDARRRCAPDGCPQACPWTGWRQARPSSASWQPPRVETPAQLQITPQAVLCIDRSDEAAAERFARWPFSST